MNWVGNVGVCTGGGLARTIFRGKPLPVYTPTFTSPVHSTHTYSPVKMEETECSETSAFKIQTPGNYPKEIIQHSKRGESLKSRTFHLTFPLVLESNLVLRSDILV
jgi:hypothetical protein